MDYLTGINRSTAEKYLTLAGFIAQDSKCLRAKCGSVIVKERRIIGAGYNAPPNDAVLERCLKDSIPKNFKSDRTCCIHAEQRAIKYALIHNPMMLEGSTIYFARINNTGRIEFAGKPFCTICSKEALDNKIARFVLWHKEGICSYEMLEYNTLSFQYRE